MKAIFGVLSYDYPLVHPTDAQMHILRQWEVKGWVECHPTENIWRLTELGEEEKRKYENGP